MLAEKTMHTCANDSKLIEAEQFIYMFSLIEKSSHPRKTYGKYNKKSISDSHNHNSYARTHQLQYLTKLTKATHRLRRLYGTNNLV